MKPIYISGESLQGESYKLFISCLFEKSNIFSYEVLKDFDILHDMEDKKYLDNILKSEKIFLHINGIVWKAELPERYRKFVLL